MRGIKQYVGRVGLFSLADGGALRGTIYRVTREGVELRKATEVIRDVAVSGVVWLPAKSITQVQFGEDS